MKRTNLLLLTHLNAEQALACLQERADSHLTAYDLYSHCREGRLPAFIKADEGGLTGEYSFIPVWGIGFHQVVNPNGLFAGRAKFTATLVGDVLTEPNSEAEKLAGVEWTAELDPDRHEVHFKSKDVVQLADDIIEAASDGPSKKAILMTVAALVELLTDPGPKNYNQDAINSAIRTKHGKLGLGKTNLEKIFSLANKTLHADR